jgi:hypothetical protein
MRNIDNYFNFIQGLISEATPFTFPPNAASDISNLDLYRTGMIARRLGLNAETNYELKPSVAFPKEIVINGGICSRVWLNVGGQSGRNFVVVQIGSTLYFHDLSADGAISRNELPFTVDLSPFVSYLSADPGKYQISVASGSGYLFVTSPVLNLFSISYDSQNNTISTQLVNCQIRDTVGLVEDIDNNFNPPSLTDEHKYNLLNQSWTDATIQAYYTQFKNYPSNSQVWYESKNTSGAFDPAGMANISFGNTLAARGHYLLDLFRQDRSQASGIPNIDPVLISTRPTGIGFFAGRLFIGVDDKVYFSQVIQNVKQAGNFYQDADPTAEIDSALVPSDGGVIPITGCAKITTIITTETAVIVGATNGIWVITGYSGNDFNATNYRVMFVANVGVGSQNNMCQAENMIIVASDGGIYALTTSDRGNIDIDNITEKTILTYYLRIPKAARHGSTLFYDSTGKKLYMFYDPDASDNQGFYRNRYTNILIWDYVLKAWTTYQLAIPTGVIAGIYDTFLLNTPVISGLQLNVTVGGNLVTVGGEAVTVEDQIPLVQETSLGYLLVSGNLTDGFKYTFGSFIDQDFVDFAYADVEGDDANSFSSYLLTGYQVLGDVSRRKSLPYIWTFLERTEQTWVDDGNGNPTLDFPSGCLLTIIWDWANRYSYFRKSNPQQIYKFQEFVPAQIGQPFEYPEDTIEAKTEIRGRGRMYRALFESEPRKDMRIYAWTTEVQIKDTPS